MNPITFETQSEFRKALIPPFIDLKSLYKHFYGIVFYSRKLIYQRCKCTKLDPLVPIYLFIMGLYPNEFMKDLHVYNKAHYIWNTF